MKRRGLIFNSRPDKAAMFALGLMLGLCPVSQAWADTNITDSQVVAQAQKKVKGQVIDATGEPLIGVNISVIGGTEGTITDIDGHFSFRADDLNGVLVVSFVGMETQEIPMKGKGTFDIVLKSSNTLLEEVQVVAYGAQKKVTLTGSISSVNTDELLKVPTASIGNMLSGVLSGVSSIQSSGQPGGDDPDVFIRGISTLNTMNAKPLYLVDGVERSFFQIDPNEVENITILKDASSTAVFGVRGANGVIIVTTKRGKEGKAKINASFSYGIQTPTRMPEFVNSYDYATFLNEAYTNDGKDPKFTPEAVEAFRTHSNPIIYPDTDWMELLFKSSAPQTQGNVNISGGTERVRYFISMGMLDQKGFFKNHDTRYDANFNFNRYNYRANLDIDFTKTTLVAINMGGRVEKRNFPRSGDDINQLFRRIYWATPFSGPGIVDGKWIKGNSQYLPVGLSDGLGNIYGRGYGSKTTNVVNLDLALTQKLDFITKGLQFKIKVAYNSGYDHTKERATSIESYQPWYRKDVTWMEHPAGSDPNEVVYIQDGEAGLISYAESFGKSRDWYAEASFDWKRDFGLHHLSALALYNQSKTYYPDSDYPGIPRGYVGLVGRVTYDYDNKYLIEGNVGYNGSENFAPGHRFGFFPAFSLGWVASEESFFNVSFIDYLKLRASYGLVGNDQIGGDRFLYLSLWESADDAEFGYPNSSGAGGGTKEKRTGNEVLTWEKAKKYNFGFDTRMFNNKLELTADVFFERRENILTSVDIIPGTYGGPAIQANAGVVENKGMEFDVTWRDRIGKNFEYFVGGNYSFARNKIVEKPESPQAYDYLYATGRRVGQSFGYVALGLFQSEEEILESPTQFGVPLYPGDIKYMDINGDGVIDSNDRYPIGFHNVPEMFYSFKLGFSYKRLDFSCLFQGAGNVTYNFQNSNIPFNNEGSTPITEWLDRWTPENRGASLPRISYTRPGNNNYQHSTFWQKNGNYLRLKNVEIGYKIPERWIGVIGAENARLYVNGTNLLTWDNVPVYDPENTETKYPLMRIINFGVKVTF